jgi:uncharacterized protein YecT (DUF1311 family)
MMGLRPPIPAIGAAALAWFLPGAALADPEAPCDAATMAGPAFTKCLTAAERRSNDALEAAFKNALASIATRPGVFDAQRPRWKNSLAESQEIWLRFRNEECQNVAPFEGQATAASVVRNRMAAFEAKLTCTVRMNEARAADLNGRYPAP